MFPWFSFLAAMLNFAGLIVWGWRWRRHRVKVRLAGRQDQHAYCASCAYDLAGRDVESVKEVQATQCPECGRAIGSDHDIVIPSQVDKKYSRSHFIWMMIAQGLVVVLMFLIFSNRILNPSIHTASTRTAPPIDQVIQAMQSSGVQKNQLAVYELDHRLRNGGLSSAEHRKLLAQAIAYQSDPTKPWEQMFGKWIEQGRVQGLVNDQQWQQYLTQPGLFRLELREHIHPGEPLVLRLHLDRRILRTSFDYSLRLPTFRDDNAMVTIYADTNEANSPAILSHTMALGSFFGNEFVPYVDGVAPLPPGKYIAVVETEFDWPTPGGAAPTASTPQPIQLTANFEIHPRTYPLFKPISDQAVASQIQDAIYQEVLRSGGTEFKQNDAGIYLTISLKDPPSSIAGSFDVSFEIGGFRSIQQWSYEPNNFSNQWREFTFRIPDRVLQNAEDPAKPFDRFTLRLTPNPDHLKQTIEGYDYLDHELWLRDIPIGLPQP